METQIQLMLTAYDDGVPMDMPRCLITQGGLGRFRVHLVGARRTADQILLVMSSEAANDDCAVDCAGGEDRALEAGETSAVR
jgi:hypothetical protein